MAMHEIKTEMKSGESVSGAFTRLFGVLVPNAYVSDFGRITLNYRLGEDGPRKDIEGWFTKHGTWVSFVVDDEMKARYDERQCTQINIAVPGEFQRGVTFLDLETVKVPTGGFRMQNGENLKNRWSIALAGVARNGWIVLFDGQEAGILRELGIALEGGEEVVYGATREFDEMICKGRFTNARRAHEPKPFFPAVPGAEKLSWQNVGVGKSGAFRADDIASRDVPAALKSEDLDAYRLVLIHLLRDVADLILEAGYPSASCAEWCRRVLKDTDFAWSRISDVVSKN